VAVAVVDNKTPAREASAQAQVARVVAQCMEQPQAAQVRQVKAILVVQRILVS
jgi:hypothetical protein